MRSSFVKTPGDGEYQEEQSRGRSSRLDRYAAPVYRKGQRDMSNVLGDVANRINFCNKLKGALGWAVNGKKEPKGVRRKNVPRLALAITESMVIASAYNARIPRQFRWAVIGYHKSAYALRKTRQFIAS
jgi:hypothetical protein